jgi:hypothetical protein
VSKLDLLYDFHIKSKKSFKTQTQKQGALMFNKNQLYVLTHYSQKNLEDDGFLCILYKKLDEFIISTDKEIWIIVNKTFPNGLKLKKNDIIMFGRLKFKIKYLLSSNTKHTSTSTIFNNKPNGKNNQIQTNKVTQVIKLNNKSISLSQSNTSLLLLHKNKTNIDNNSFCAKLLNCRICLLPDNELNKNPIVSICNCNGNMANTHLKCLIKWYNSKVLKTKLLSNSYYEYDYSNIRCELCKFDYSDKINVKNKEVSLLEINLPSNYIILQPLYNYKKILIFDMNLTTSITIGKSVESNYVLNDLSISNNHSVIKHINNNFYLFDNDSMFGTFIKHDYDMILCLNKPLYILIDNKELVFNFNRNFYFFLCCCLTNFKFPFKNYNDYLESDNKNLIEFTNIVLANRLKNKKSKQSIINKY